MRIIKDGLGVEKLFTMSQCVEADSAPSSLNPYFANNLAYNINHS